LDKNQNPQPPGITGELVLSGAGVAKGYFKRETLTSEKFIPNTLLEKEEIQSPYDRLYRTGDLARQLPDGKLEFLGRIDHQVKIRGYRIELGEIEQRLLEHREIKEAVVLVLTSENGGKYLCAYIVPTEYAQTGTQDNLDNHDNHNHVTGGDRGLKEYLALALPEYMVPGYYIYLENLPLTPNGKLDRKTLPRPQLQQSRDYVAPRDRIEEKLTEVWAESLNIEKNVISINANFFELGGHSLKATVMVAKLQKELNVNLQLVEIFNASTVRELAELIRNRKKYTFISIEPVERKEYYPMSSAQKRLYIIHQLEPQGIGYNMPRNLPVSETDPGKLETAFLRLMEQHESLRTSFHMLQEETVQKIHEPGTVTLEIENYEAEPGESFNNVTTQFVRAFDLAQPPLLRVGMLTVKTPEKPYHILMIDMHHIISDGVSVKVLGEDFLKLYEGETLTPLRIQYKEYTLWQNRELGNTRLKAQEAHWQQRFSGEIPELNLPTDYPRPAILGYRGITKGFEINPIESRRLKTMALDQNTTPYMFLLANFSILLSKLAGQEDIVIGTPTAGRRHA
ncbi:MAG: AMP-binding protein, partial [Desulfobacteraceae bacterium]|nr:AMP-binding protein [Desulfobacteraceae bacterium]